MLKQNGEKIESEPLEKVLTVIHHHVCVSMRFVSDCCPHGSLESIASPVLNRSSLSLALHLLSKNVCN